MVSSFSPVSTLLEEIVRVSVAKASQVFQPAQRQDWVDYCRRLGVDIMLALWYEPKQGLNGFWD
jgi:hypothetical protein